MDKEKLKEIAFSFVGTPHIAGGRMKGKNGGVDCANLPLMIYEELGYGRIEGSGCYSEVWFMKSNCKELLLPKLEEYCYQIDKNDLQEGDIIAYQWGRAVSHLAVVIDKEKQWVIHAHADAGVEIVTTEAPYFLKKNGQSREHSYWRLKENIK